MICEALTTIRKLGIARQRLASLPAARAIAFADRRIGIFAESRSQRPLVPWFCLQARDRSAAALFQRPRKRIVLRLRGTECGACRCEAALRPIALLGRRGSALFRLNTLRLRLGKGLGGRLGSRLGFGTRVLLFASVPQCGELVGEL